jgi:hypothetical protein
MEKQILLESCSILVRVEVDLLRRLGHNDAMRQLLFVLALATTVIPAWQVRSDEVAALNRSGGLAIAAAPSSSPVGVVDRRANSWPELLVRLDGAIGPPHVATPAADWWLVAVDFNRGGTRTADSLQALGVRWQI